MAFVLFALGLSMVVGAGHAYQRVSENALRWGVRRRAAEPSDDRTTYREAGPADRFSRRRVPAIVRVAAMLAGAAQFGLLGLVLLGALYGAALLFTESGLPTLLLLALSLVVALPPLAMAYALQRYLSALVLVQENVPANVDGAVAVIALLFIPSVLALAAFTTQPAWLALGAPVLGAVLVCAGAAQAARDAALRERERRDRERDHLHG